ncbi:MAG: hypothetical protein HY514_05175 [Candidatus Aenigmarchaeota archaeon]|nr:hypothetical protein [Candidatus Aenigmarchaeota archaeon]
MHIVKRQGHKEKFDSRKIYASVYYACRSTHMGKKACEKTAGKVSTEINTWAKSKSSMTSDQIFREIAKRLKKYDTDAAFMYETHRDIS